MSRCAQAGCAQGGGDACKTCVNNNRKSLEGQCWPAPCPDGKCFYRFTESYCYGKNEAPSPPLASPVLAAAANATCTCVLRGGRYDRAEDAVVLAGTAGQPVSIALEGYGGDAEPAVIDGSVSLDTLGLNWTHDGSDGRCVWRSSALPPGAQVPWQLWFANGTASSAWTGLAPLTPARWPNARLSDLSVFSTAGRADGALAHTAVNSSAAAGTFYDDGSHDPPLAAAGVDATGALAVLPLGTMGDNTLGWTVTEHAVGRAAFQTAPPGAAVAGHGHPNVPYFLEGSAALLDTEEEWAWDAGARQLLLWTPGCAPPASLGLRGKVRSYAINASFAALSLRRLAVFGATLAATNTRVQLDTVQWLWPTASRRALGVSGEAGAAAPTLTAGAKGSLSMRNSTWAWDDPTSAPFVSYGSGAVFENNLWHANGYAGGSAAALEDHGSPHGLTFVRNTVQHTNAFTALTPGYAANISLNLFRYQGPPQDGAMVHVHIGPQDGVLIDRNWAHDTGVKAFRFDRVNSATATWGVNGTVTRNVAWRTAGMFIKGDQHRVLSNTIFDTNAANAVPALAAAASGAATGAPAGAAPAKAAGQPGISVMMFDPTKKWAKKGENAHTKYERCASDWLFNVSGALAGDGGSAAAAAGAAGSAAGDVGGHAVVPQLQGAAQQDFRARAGSAIAAAGAGAYAEGASGSEYWVPGQQLSAASQPVAGGLAGAGMGMAGPMLAWRGAFAALGHAVHVGRDRRAVASAPPPAALAAIGAGRAPAPPSPLLAAPSYAAAVLPAGVTTWLLRGEAGERAAMHMHASHGETGTPPLFLPAGATLYWRVDVLPGGGSGAVQRGQVWSATATGDSDNRGI
eukprot:g2241.t1